MATSQPKIGRAKVSTTLARENYRYLEKRVASGKAHSIAEAIDQSVEALRQRDNRKRLAAATANYFNSLHPDAAAEEKAIAGDLASVAKDIDFDKEP
jgi:Arc/MetJ-type ribon-helix-helix transcriptional regulator